MPLTTPPSIDARAPSPSRRYFASFDRSKHSDARVVAEDVHLAEHPLGLIRGPDERCAVGDIQAEGGGHSFPVPSA